MIIIDETEHLASVDIRNNNSIMHWLRYLLNEKRINLIITAYPHGKEEKYALPSLINQTHTPYYNLLKPIKLNSWSPDETWIYISGKLQLMGVHLPKFLKEEVLNLTRGIPWITNLLGQYACEINNISLITLAHWTTLKSHVKTEIEKELKITVSQIAEDFDREYKLFNKKTYSGYMQKNLWNSLINIVKHYSGNDFLYSLGDTIWSNEITFTDSDVQKYFTNRVELDHVRQVLSKLTGTIVLKGLETNKHKYKFSDNLLPILYR